MGAQQTSTTNQTQTQTANPVTANVVGGLLPQALNTAATPYNVLMNPEVAPLTAMQQGAIAGLGGLQYNNPASPFIQQANQYSQTAADPNSVVKMQQQFYNPAASAVEAQLSNILNQQTGAAVGNAAASGALGGSRGMIGIGNTMNQEALAAGQTLAGLQQQALQAAQTEQGQISQQAFTQGQLGNEALNTQTQGIMAALQGGQLTQQQAQQLLNAQQTGAIQQTLWTPQMLSMALNQAGAGTMLGGTTTGTGTNKQPVNYAGQIIGGGLAGVGLMGGVPGISSIFGGGGSGDQSGSQFVARGGRVAHRAEGGATPNLEADLENAPQVSVPQEHFPVLNLSPQQSAGSGSGSSSSGGLGGLGGLGSLASLGSSAGSGLSSLASGAGSALGAIGSGIGDAAGAVGGALGGMSFADFLPALAFLADGGSVRKHRAIGGGTGVGLGDSGVAAYGGMPSSGGLTFDGIQSALAPHLARSPQVSVPAVHFPTIDLSPKTQNTAQQQSDQQFKQMVDLAQQGQKIGQQYPVSGLNDTSTEVPEDNTYVVTGAAHGGRIHRQDGGETVQDVTAQPSMADFIQRRIDQKYPVPPSLGSGAIVNPNAPAQASIASVNPITMGDLSPTPGPQQYVSLDYQGRQVGGPQPAELDPALLQRAPIQQAAIASPAQAPPPAPPAPIAQPAQPGQQQWTPQKVAQNTIDTFRGGGASDNAIRGVLVNYNDESGFNPGLRHWDQPHFVGEAAYAHGLAQEGGGEWNRYTSWLNQAHPHADWRDPNLQNQFLLWNLQTNYPKVWEAMNNAPTGEQAAQAFLHGYLKPSFANEQRRSEQYGRGIPGLDDLVKNAGTANFSANRSVLDRSDLQPPKPGESNLDQRLRDFGLAPGQPQGLGGSLARAFGLPTSANQQGLNSLTNLGLGMMAAGPTVGIGGFPGAAISALTSAGKGGQFALNQEQQERTQAINLANAAMNQKLHEAQIANYQREASQPRQIGSHVIIDDYGQPHVVPVMGQPPGTKPEEQWRELPSSTSQNNNQAGTAPGEPDRIDAIPPNVTGDDFAKEAKKAGISPYLVDAASQVAKYDADENKLASYRGNQRLIIDRLAHRINPDYDIKRYAAVADSEKKLYSGKTAESLSRIGRLFDEIDIAYAAADKLDKQGHSGYETINEQYAKYSKSASPYAKARDSLGYAIDNLSQSAASVAKGNNTSAETDAKRRFELLNPNKSTDNLKNTFMLEAETALKNAQTNLTLNNKAHGYEPDNPKYRTALDFMAPAQRKRAIEILGPAKIEEITEKPLTEADLRKPTLKPASKKGEKETLAPQEKAPAQPAQTMAAPANQPQQAAPTIPTRPAGVPEGAGYSAKTGKWYDPVTHQPIQ